MIALIGSLLASTIAARSYMQDQLALKNADNALALALTLSQQQPDEILVELAVSALFDSGHYEYIEVVDPQGIVMISRREQAAETGVPGWFMKILPINAAPGEAQLSGGWIQFGSVILESHSRFAYEALWSSVLRMLGASALAGVAGGILGSLILSRLRAPLDAVINQAEAITTKQFVSIDLSSVPELHKLGEAMNGMVQKLREIFAEDATKLEFARARANTDELTLLPNRAWFISEMRSRLEEESSSGCSVIFLHISRLADLNREIGREGTDALISRIGETVEKIASAESDSLAARLNGSDFGIVLPLSSAPTGMAEQLLDAVSKDLHAFSASEHKVYLSTGSFPVKSDISAVLSRLDTAIATAESRGNSCLEPVTDNFSELPSNTEEWALQLSAAVEAHHIKLATSPVVDMAGKLLHLETHLRIKPPGHDDWLVAGQFFPMAERLGLTGKLDLEALKLALDLLQNGATAGEIAMSLSGASLSDPVFWEALETICSRRPAELSRLWIEVSEEGALDYYDEFSQLLTLMKPHGCKVGIEHFGRRLSEIGKFHGLGLYYLKVDSSFIHNLDQNLGNLSFLHGLARISHDIGAIVIAEGVTRQMEYEILSTLGFDGATGHAIRL